MDTGHLLAMVTCEHTPIPMVKWLLMILMDFLAGSITSSTKTSSVSVYYGGSCSTVGGRRLSK